MAENIKSFTDFQSKLVSDIDLQNQFKQDPVAAVNKFAQSPQVPNTLVYQIVVLSLGASIILVIIAIVIMYFKGTGTADQQVPTIFTAIASGSIGALAGLLSPSPKSGS